MLSMSAGIAGSAFFMLKQLLHEKIVNFVSFLLMNLPFIAGKVTFWTWLAGCYPVRNGERKL
jgi:hypothetical protein